MSTNVPAAALGRRFNSISEKASSNPWRRDRGKVDKPVSGIANAGYGLTNFARNADELA